MAVDYVFVGASFTFISGMVFMLLAMEHKEYPNAIIYHFLAAIEFFVLSTLFLMAYGSSTAVLPLWMLFFGFGMLNFAYFFVWLWQMFGAMKQGFSMKTGKPKDEED